MFLCDKPEVVALFSKIYVISCSMRKQHSIGKFNFKNAGIFIFKIIMTIILIYLAYLMYKEKKESKETKINNLLSIFLFAFSVSIDSFTVGIGLNALTNKIIIPPIIFSLCSGSITYMGLLLGKYSKKLWKEKAINIGIILLILISLVNICQLFF